MSKTKRNKVKRKVNKRNLWTLILVFLVIIEMIVATVGLVTLGNMLQGRPDLVLDDFLSPESTHIFDSDGNQIADVGLQLRDNVTYDEMSESLIDCFVAVEDSRFFTHDGFDLPRFTKSAITNVKNKLLHRSGLQGGSTFTMQLVKLTYFTNDETGTIASQTVEYKVQQIALARELEKSANKKTIFELYLNKMNFGGTGNIRGIEKAAQYYYGKSASQLNLVESAMLAGVINSPYYYDPHNFLDYATTRRNTVLYQMYNHGYITKDEYKLATSVKVEDTLIDPTTTSTGNVYAYQSYIDEVIKEATGLTGQDPLSVAMNIYTCMDPTVQQVMDDIQAGKKEEVVFPDDLMEIGIICENNQTGEVVAIGGGRNYGRGGSMLLNHATDQYKQPGSSVKPFLDYALAFEYLGWATDHVVTDQPIAYAGTNIVIKNANGQYYGQVPLSYAIAASLNTPAIQALQDAINTAGWQTVVDYVTSLGFSKVSADNFDIGFAIGGSNFTCSAEELNAAHAVLMNGGNYIQPHTISRIEYRSGTQEPLVPQYQPTPVLSPEAAYLAAQLMYTAVHSNVYNYLGILDRSYATYGKTGTSDWGTEGLQYNIPQGASKDKWMVVDTSQYTTTVWVGYEKGVKDAGTYFNMDKSLLNIPGNILSLVLDALAESNGEPDALSRPDGITSITHILGTFPYAAPVADMDPAYITTGEIKTANASLVDPESAEEVDQLESFNTIYNDDGTVTMTWAAYPDQSKLTPADSTMDISLYDSSGNMLVEAWGARLFDYSWIYGPIRYKVRISQNGSTIGELVSDSEESTQSIDLELGTETEACGYYGYENGAGQSNEICVRFTPPKPKEEEKPKDDKKDETTSESESEKTEETKPDSQSTDSKNEDH